MTVNTKRTVAKAEFSRIAGVSKPMVTKLCNGQLKDALIDGKIDIDHPLVVDYLEERSTTATPKNDKKPIANPQVKTPRTDPVQANANPFYSDIVGAGGLNINEIEKMTLHEIAMRFGTDERFVKYLKARDQIESIKIKQVRASEAQKDYIPRALVSDRIIPMIDTVFSRLVGDFPLFLTNQLVARVQAGADNHEIQDLVANNISKIIKDVKSETQRHLKK